MIKDYDPAGAVDKLRRQVATLRGLVQKTNVALEVLQEPDTEPVNDLAQRKQLDRVLEAVQTDGDVIVGPWTGEVGFELLYWIPFLNWLATRGLDGRRVVVVSRGGAAPWYRHLTTRYIDLFDLMTPDELRRRVNESRSKQYSPQRALDREILATVRSRHALERAAVIHPSAMYRLFAALWRKRATIDLLEPMTSYQRLGEPADADSSLQLPRDYIAAKFYFSTAFPDTGENRTFVADLLGRVSRQAPVVLLSTPVRIDDHYDFRAESRSGVFVVDAHRAPRENLDLQTQIIRGSRGFIGTYGGFSYLAPFYGVRALSFFSRRGFESHHLELAHRVFDRLFPGGFTALGPRALDLIEPAVARWGSSGYDVQRRDEL